MMQEVASPAQLARGVIACGFDGDDFAALADFAGYVLFANNGTSVRAVRQLTDELRRRRGTPPLVAIDQEGGRVARLREGAEPIPSMMAVGAAGNPDLAVRAGEQIAFDLRRAGCTFDLAPVLDLARDPANTVIGNRSFGADPRLVALLGERLARGLRNGGIVPCFKHFPGHGSTHVDSHVALPVVDDDAATLLARDVVPFAAVAREAEAIMGAHVVVRAFDPQAPATLSPRAVAMLRDKLGFGGAYVTDCLEMGAVSGAGAAVAVSALAAGADLLLFSHDPQLAVEAAGAIERAVAGGILPRERLEEAYARVMRLRRGAQPPLPLDAFPPHAGVGREIARRAIRLVRGVPHADPTTSHAISFGGEGGPSLRREAPALEETIVSIDPSGDDARRALEAVVASDRRPIVLARRAHLHPAQDAAIARLVERFHDAVVVSMIEPFDVDRFAGARHVLAAYGDDDAAIGGLSDVLFGGAMPRA